MLAEGKGGDGFIVVGGKVLLKFSGRTTSRSIWKLCLLSELGFMKDRCLIGVNSKVMGTDMLL